MIYVDTSGTTDLYIPRDENLEYTPGGTYEDGYRDGYSDGYGDGYESGSTHSTEELTVTLTANGTRTFIPEPGKTFSRANINVNIPPDIWQGTQDEYEALPSHDNNVLYIISCDD